MGASSGEAEGKEAAEAAGGSIQESGKSPAGAGAVDGELEEQILQLALANAVSHGGRTIHKTILGKILGARGDLRGSIPAVSEAVLRAVSEVNEMTAEEQQERLDIKAARPGGQKAGRGGGGGRDRSGPGGWLPPIEGAVHGEVVTRFPPEPNGYPHIGHAKAAIINMDYAAKYGGRCILRIDDTNPEAERKEYLAGINVGLEWLGLEFAPQDIRHTSDDMELLYKKGEELIQAGTAYVCTCKRDDISRNRMERKGCKCSRNTDPDWHYKRWSKMHTKFRSGEAVARFRGDMGADNAVMRDPVLFRIIGTPHYRQGARYRVWPSYDMAVAVEDSAHGITDAFRSKEFESREQLINAILDALRMRKPRQHYFARLAFEGMPTSKRMIKPLMEDGRIVGYDDPRIPTLGGLKRRGIRPAAVRKFVESLGMTKSDTVAPFETLESLNRSEVDSQSTRLFMVRDAKRLAVSDPDGLMERTVRMPNHPLHDEMGVREVPASSDLYISGSDLEKIREGSVVRLLGLAYVRITRIVDGGGRSGGGGGGGGINRYFGSDRKGGEIAAHADYIMGMGGVDGRREGKAAEGRQGLAGPAEGGSSDAGSGHGSKKPKGIEEDAKMQWISCKAAVPIRLSIPKKPFDGDRFVEESMEEAEVYTEPHFENVGEGAEIQFVRFGYCRKDSGRRVIFTHG